MIAIDTNILARFYVDDPTDPEAGSQREIARRVMTESEALFVPVTVVLEFAWVLKAFYRFERDDVSRVIEHLIGLPNVSLEDAAAVLDATGLFRKGLDFADALHLARSGHCERLLTFDDRKFARRAARLGALPAVAVPS